MAKELEFEVVTEPATVAHYGRDWSPAPGFARAAKWPAGIVTGQSGNDYFGIRGFDDFVLGMTHTLGPFCSFYKLQNDGIVGRPDELYPEYGGFISRFEPFQIDETAEQVTYGYDSGRVEEHGAGLRWVDASERWQLQGTRLSDTFVLHIPEQEGVPVAHYYRHELSHAHSGAINGDPVEGYLHQDFCYAPHGYTYMEMALVRELEGIWFSWIHQYADGEWGGGCLWQGKHREDFRPGYLLRNGQTVATKDAVCTVGDFNEKKRPREVRVELNGEWYEFQMRSRSGLAHFFGPLTAQSDPRPVVKSWSWLEYTAHVTTPGALSHYDRRFELARRK